MNNKRMTKSLRAQAYKQVRDIFHYLNDEKSKQTKEPKMFN